MPRTDDLRIRELKELTPPSHLIREFPCSEHISSVTANARTALQPCSELRRGLRLREARHDSRQRLDYSRLR